MCITCFTFCWRAICRLLQGTDYIHLLCNCYLSVLKFKYNLEWGAGVLMFLHKGWWIARTGHMPCIYSGFCSSNISPLYLYIKFKSLLFWWCCALFHQCKILYRLDKEYYAFFDEGDWLLLNITKERFYFILQKNTRTSIIHLRKMPFTFMTVWTH